MNYQKLREIDKLWFNFQEMARLLDISPESAKVTVSRYVKRGILLKLKRDVYVLRDRWDALKTEQKLVLANVIQVPSYISLMTALGFYQLTTQIQQGFIESVAVKRTIEFGVDKTIFRYTKINTDLYFGFSRENGIFIASPEKALLDAVYLMSLKRYRFDTTSLNFGRINKPAAVKMARKFPLRTRRLLEEIWQS